MLFGVPARKDAEGSEAWSPEGIGQRAIATLRRGVRRRRGRDRRSLPRRVHGSRPLRRAERTRRGRQRSDGGALHADRAGPGRGRRPHGGTERDDGRPGRGDPRGARRCRPRRRGDHGLRGEVRLRVVRAVPRGRRGRPEVRGSAGLPAGCRERRRGAPRDPRRHRAGGRHRDGEARAPLPRPRAPRRRTRPGSRWPRTT